MKSKKCKSCVFFEAMQGRECQAYCNCQEQQRAFTFSYEEACEHYRERKRAFEVFIDKDCEPVAMVMMFSQKNKDGECVTHKIEKRFVGDADLDSITIRFDDE